MELELRVNGVVESLDAAPNESLLTLLRCNGYTSVKQGCETGECGACTVLVDGVPRTSCVMLAAQAGGCALTTAEGLQTSNTLGPLQQAFIALGATQCGFCIPGMMLSASALLKRTLQPTEDEIRDALSGNLCRCMGYEKPVQAVLRAASILRGDVPAEYSNTSNGTRVTAKQRTVQSSTPFTGTGNSPFSVIGKAVPAVDGTKKVTGRATFTDDISLKGMLYAKILTSPHAHAIIRSIDTSEARAMPGVHAVLTYQDVQRVPYAAGGEMGPQDHYSLDYIVRYIGDRVAVVAAETPELAQRAIERISVEYEVLPALLDPRQTLEANGVQIHAESESRNIYDAQRNVAVRTRTETGDVERGFAEADRVIEGEYIIPMTRQATLETHSVITYFDEDDYLVVRSNAYTPHSVRRVLATILAIPPHRIRVEQPTLGLGPATQRAIVGEDICALLTHATRRPVRLVYSREDELRESGSYSQQIVRMKTGVKRDGTLVANQMIVLASAGAYGTYTLISEHTLELYSCAHTRFIAEVLYTNLPPASNTPAANAEMFALESHMDEIARQLNMDAITLRRKNLSITGTQAVAENTVSECMELVETKLQWSTKRGQAWNSLLHRGVGVAFTRYDNTNVESSGAIVKLNEDGSFDVFVSVADPTVKTMLAQIAAEVLNVSVHEILLHASTTDIAPSATTTNAASSLYNAGAALRRVAEQVRRQVLIIASRMLNAIPENLTIHEGIITPSPLNGQTLTLAQVATALFSNEGKQIIASASWKEAHPPIAYAVGGAEVEVNIETGAVRVVKLIAALDAGRVIHPSLAQTQIQGSMVQGLGLSTSEEVLYDAQGQVLVKTLSDYHIYNAAEIPELQTYFVQNEAASTGVFGAKSLLEVAQNGVAPAIANAVADALGFPIRQLPLTPERVLRAIHTYNAKRS